MPILYKIQGTSTFSLADLPVPPTIIALLTAAPSFCIIMDSLVKKSNDDTPDINSLPAEIILKIFGYFTQNEVGQFARVCSRWNIIARSPILWKKVNIEFKPSLGSQMEVVKNFTDRLPTCCTYIRLNFRLIYGCIEPLHFEELSVRLKKRCPHLEMLILDTVNISDSLPSVIDMCSELLEKIQVLVFRSCTFPNYPTKGEYGGATSKIEVLGVNCCQIQHFNTPTFSRMAYIKELYLTHMNIYDSWFENKWDLFNQLHVLDVGFTRIGSWTFQAIGTHAFNLRELYMCCTYLKDSDLKFNNLVFPNLKTICLRSCRGAKVTCRGVVSLIQSCYALQNVYVDEDVAASYAVHPFAVNESKLEIVKAIECSVHYKLRDYFCE